jgi:DNA-binding NarL/FixJ family response regulator
MKAQVEERGQARGIRSEDRRGRMLSPREHLVATEVARGTPLKVVAANMDISLSAAASYFQRARIKLGAPSRAALQRCLSNGARIVNVRPLLSPLLSPAELFIAEEILKGRCNGEIAQRRGTSVRTIATQIAHLFRKLQIRSRHELFPLVIHPAAKMTIAAGHEDL